MFVSVFFVFFFLDAYYGKVGEHDGKIEFEFQKTLQQLVWMKMIKCVRPKEINSSIVDARKLLF